MSRGYKVDEVDAFLDRVEATLAGEPVGSPVTADEVDDVVFRVRFGGYDEWQVDVYLDRVARQLAELEERGVLGSAPAPDYGKPDTGAAQAAPAQAPAAPTPAPGQRRASEPQATQVIPAATQAIPAHEVMAAREMAPPPPAPAPVARGGRAAPAPAPRDADGFGDLRGDDDEGFGFLAGPPGEDYDDPFAKRNGADPGMAPPPGGAEPGFGTPRGMPEPAPAAQAPAGDFGAPRGPEPVGPRGDFGPPPRGAGAPPQRAGMPGPQAGSSPHGNTEQLPLQSDPRRGGFGPPEQAQGYGPEQAQGYGPPQGRGPERPAPGFGAAYEDEFSDTGSRRAAVPPQQAPSPAPPAPQAYPGAPTGAIPQAGYGQQAPPEREPMPPAPPTQAIPSHLVPGQQTQGMPAAQPQEPPYGAQRGRGFTPEPQGQEDTGYGRRAAAPSPPMPGGYGAPQDNQGGFGGPADNQGGFGGPPDNQGGFGGPADNQGGFGAPQDNQGGFGAPPENQGGFGPPDNQGGFGGPADSQGGFGAPPAPPVSPPPQQPRGAATPPDFGRRNPYEGRGQFEQPGRHGREEMTTEMRATDSPFTSDDVQRLEQLRRAFQPRRFGSGYDPGQVDQMFDAVSAAMTGRNPVPLSDRELDTSQFSLVQGGYFEAEVDSALREVRELFARRGMMH